MNLSNFYAGVVASYDAATRTCRVRIPGVTDGAEVFPVAEMLYPMGDKSEHTDIRVLVGDRVVVGFYNGDSEYPFIVGFRPKAEGNAIDVRRFEHKNIEMQADTDMLLQATAGKLTQTVGTDLATTAGGAVTVKAGTTVFVEAGGTITFKASNVIFDAPVTMNHTLTLTGLFTFNGGYYGTGETWINGFVSDQRHVHLNVSGGTGISGPVRPGL